MKKFKISDWVLFQATVFFYLILTWMEKLVGGGVITYVKNFLLIATLFFVFLIYYYRVRTFLLRIRTARRLAQIKITIEKAKVLKEKFKNSIGLLPSDNVFEIEKYQTLVEFNYRKVEQLLENLQRTKKTYETILFEIKNKK